MVSELDIKTLQKAGISDVGQLVQAAASFLRAYPLYKNEFPKNALSIQEERLLRAVGVDGGTTSFQESYRDNITIVAAECALMAATALSQYETANLLGVSMSLVRQRIQDRTLYNIQGISGLTVFPRFQFFNSRTLPGLETVLSAINPNAHPVSVQRFFITPTIDLESAEFTEPISPRNWLISGYSIDAVVILAQEL